MNLFLLVLGFLTTFGFAKRVPGKSEFESRGIVLLDAFTYPVIFPSSGFTAVIGVFNKNLIGNHVLTDRYRELLGVAAKEIQPEGEQQKILFGQIIVNGAENKNLSMTIGAAEVPQLLLIRRGQFVGTPVPDEDKLMTIGKLAEFLEVNTGIVFSPPGSIAEFDVLVVKYKTAVDAEDRKGILAEARALLAGYEQAPSDIKKTAEFYVKTMQHVMEAGDKYLVQETNRISKLLKSESITSEKRADFEVKMRIVNKFRSYGFVTPENSVRNDLL